MAGFLGANFRFFPGPGRFWEVYTGIGGDTVAMKLTNISRRRLIKAGRWDGEFSRKSMATEGASRLVGCS